MLYIGFLCCTFCSHWLLWHLEQSPKVFSRLCWSQHVWYRLIVLIGLIAKRVVLYSKNTLMHQSDKICNSSGLSVQTVSETCVQCVHHLQKAIMLHCDYHSAALIRDVACSLSWITMVDTLNTCFTVCTVKRLSLQTMCVEVFLEYSTTFLQIRPLRPVSDVLTDVALSSVLHFH